MAEIPSSPRSTTSTEESDHGPLPPLMGEIPPSQIAQARQDSQPSSESLEFRQQTPQALVQRSAIRTMKTDIERLFETAPPSVAQMIGKSEPMSPAAKKHVAAAILYTTLGILLLAAGSGIYYFRNTIFAPSAPIEIKKAVPPAPFFATESSRTLEVAQSDRQQFIGLMNDAMKEFERDGTIKRILIKYTDTPEQHYAAMSDFLGVYHIAPPESFLKRLIPGLMVFVYTSSGTRLGIATRTSDPTRTMRDMLDWEPKMLLDMKPLFFGQTLSPVTPLFEDRTYHNIDWRYLKLSSDADIGIGYTVFPAGSVLVIATSKALMETAINRLFEAR